MNNEQLRELRAMAFSKPIHDKIEVIERTWNHAGLICKSIEWRKNGLLHREDGPAVVWSGGTYWYKNGLLHRDNGPALETDPTRSWYKNGVLHREDGPAYESYNGKSLLREWYVDGKIKRIERTNWCFDLSQSGWEKINENTFCLHEGILGRCLGERRA